MSMFELYDLNVCILEPRWSFVALFRTDFVKMSQMRERERERERERLSFEKVRTHYSCTSAHARSVSGLSDFQTL